MARKLSLRPSPSDLKDKNILKGGEDIEEEPEPTFQERQQKLKSCMKKRPEKSELEQQNILKGIVFHSLIRQQLQLTVQYSTPKKL